jgi:hypothetical protein
MKTFTFTPHRSRSILALAAVAFAVCVADAATLTVTPSTISNTYVGMVTLQIGGLTNGEIVRIGKFVDVDGDGSLGANDWLMQGFRVADGKVRIIGGATNYNVPCDLTGTNGEITTLLNYTASDNPDHTVGQYLFVVVSSSGTAATNTLTLTNWPYSQSITGAVHCSGTNVPNAMAVLLVPEPDGHMPFGGGTVADGSGNFNIKMPPGVYVPFPIHRGCVANLAAGIFLTLDTNATVTTNFDLIPATRNLAGRLVDAGDTNTGLGGVFLFVQSVDGQATISSTDTNGIFNIPVTAGFWQVEPDSSALRTLGYVALQDFPAFDTTAGDVTNALIVVPRGGAMFYGTIKTDSNAPLAGIGFYGDDSNHVYQADGLSDTNGNYSVAALPGAWSVGPNDSNPGLAGYILTAGTNTVLSPNQAFRLDFVAKRATGTISGQVKDNLSNTVAGIFVHGEADIGGNHYFSYTHTDATGNYSFGVANGTWTVGLSCSGEGSLQDLGYGCVMNQTVPVPPTNAVVNFTVYPPGPLAIATSSLPGGTVGVFYGSQVFASGGQFPYSWTLAPGSGPLPPELNLAPDGNINGTPTTSGTFNFTVRVTDISPTNVDQALSITINPAPGSQTVIENPQMLADGQFQFSFNTFTGTNYTVLYSTNLTSWIPVLTFRGPGGMMTIIDPNATHPVQFYRIRIGP